jgi:hypothetical protein
MAIGVSRPEAGRLTVQKLTDYRLHLAASRDYLTRHPLHDPEDLPNHRFVGYIPDMIFDKELDYLAEIGAGPAVLTSNSVSVQLNWLRHGAGVGIVHDFALPAAPELQRVMSDRISLTRAFWLIRHQDDARLDRLNRFADQLRARGPGRDDAAGSLAPCRRRARLTDSPTGPTLALRSGGGPAHDSPADPEGKGGHAPVVTVPSNASLSEVAQVLSARRIGAVVVSDDAVHPLGILSERDIVRELG